jgi:hypothetical protein
MGTLDRYTLDRYTLDKYPLDKYRSLSRGSPDYSARLDGPLTYKIYGPYEEIAYTPSPTMCYVIVTCRSMLWTLLTIVSTVMVVAAVITPQWLIGKPRWLGLRSAQMNGSVYDHQDRTYNPTIGLFNRCTKVHLPGSNKQDHCANFVTGFDMPSGEFPDFWKSALILFAVAVVLLGFTVISALLSLCIRAICKKSIFTVSGFIQSIAGLFLIIAQMLYPCGWGAERVKTLCGSRASPFMIDECQIGWAFYMCMGGTVLVFITAVLSIQAETSTSSDKVESEVLEGKNLICIP